MRLIPFESLTLRTPLAPDDAQRKLAEAVEPVRWIRAPFSRPQKPFEGELTLAGFTISRVLTYRNSFNPIAVGTIRGEEGGTAIDLVLRPHLGVAIFMTLWLGFALVAGCAVESTEIARGHALGPGLVPFGMFLFGYLTTMGGFFFEAKRTKRQLEEILR